MEEGLTALKSLLPAASGSAVVLAAEWDKVIAHWPGSCPGVLLNFRAVDSTPARASLLDQISTTGRNKRPSLMVALVQTEIARVMGLDPANPPDPYQGVFGIGMDSLMAIELKNRLEAGFGCSLPPTIVFDCPSAAALADYLLERIPLHSSASPVNAGAAASSNGSPAIAAPLNSETPADVRTVRPSSFELPRERFVGLRGQRSCVCEWGSESSPPVVCVHGALDQAGIWASVATALAPAGCSVFAPDLRGHGRSDHARSYQLADFLADLEQLSSDSRLDGEPFILVGHSMGAALAAIFAALWPERVRALVLLELPSSSEESKTEGDAVTLLMHQVQGLLSPPPHPLLRNLKEAVDRLRHVNPSLTFELASMLAQRILQPSDGGFRWSWDPLLKIHSRLELSGGTYWQILRQIALPVTLVYGAASNFVSSEGMRLHEGVLPSARKVTLQCGHHIPLEDPLTVAQLIVEATASAAALNHSVQAVEVGMRGSQLGSFSRR
jgi:pimeloyl-ACP methyl ester carboxylesterase